MARKRKESDVAALRATLQRREDLLLAADGMLTVMASLYDTPRASRKDIADCRETARFV